MLLASTACDISLSREYLSPWSFFDCVLLVLLFTSDITFKHQFADDKQLYMTFEVTTLNYMELCKRRLWACAWEIYTWVLLNKSQWNKDQTELLVISSLYRARSPLSPVAFVCRVLGSSKPVTLQLFSINLWVWLFRWQQGTNRHSVISETLASFVNISRLMQPNFLFTYSSDQSLTT